MVGARRGERVALVLILLALVLEVGGVLFLRHHYLALFSSASALRPTTLGSSRALMWALGSLGACSITGGSYLLLRYARWWLVLVLLPLCFVVLFVAVIAIYAMMVIEGWV